MPFLSVGKRRTRRAFALSFLVLGACSVTEGPLSADGEDPSLARKSEPVASLTITPPTQLASTSPSVIAVSYTHLTLPTKA